ncbi:MAG: DUF445 domain-containing protein [Gammaproteobacteria bacterium]|nr:MAG: DUF445 domain-containing protein [Gammaproteobacteria bacterium]
MNKSLITNLLAISLMILGYFINNAILSTIGLFAFSGAITNWLAIHMLFEKVPGLYGSGVIPMRFNEFKSAIRNMMMNEFFTQENISKFMQGSGSNQLDKHLAPVIEKVDLDPAFDKLVTVIMDSSFGGMLSMFGGEEALHPLREPFIENMKVSLVEMTQSEKFKELLADELGNSESSDEIQTKITEIIDQRLDELTPQMVKEIVQRMIKEHLGWLVIWGGVFGGVIGGISTICWSTLLS